MEGFCDLGGDVVVARERENRLGMGGRGRDGGTQAAVKSKKGRNEATGTDNGDYVSSRHTTAYTHTSP
jgi:hypothetical protein